MTVISLFAQELDIKWDLSQIFAISERKDSPLSPCF